MNKSIFTYLRTSGLLRALSALVFVVLTGSSAAAGVCSSCPVVLSNSASQSVATCPMSPASDATSAKQPTCCCSHAENSPASLGGKTLIGKDKTVKQAPMSCCSKGAGDVASFKTAHFKSVQTDQNAMHATAESGTPAVQPLIEQTDFGQAPVSTVAKATTCKNSGHCPGQMRTNSHTSSSPPPRSFERERQENLTTLIQQPHTLHIVERFTAPISEVSSVLSGEPPILSGIGSQLLLC